MPEKNILEKQLLQNKLFYGGSYVISYNKDWSRSEWDFSDDVWRISTIPATETPYEKDYGILGIAEMSQLYDKDAIKRVHFSNLFTPLLVAIDIPKDKNIEVALLGIEKIELPLPLKEISLAIEESRYMLSLEDNWDEEGSIKYDYVTWKRAVSFIANYSTLIFNKFNKVIPTPKIYHSIDGSIDVLWKNKNYQLLINIPSGNLPAKFYGDNYAVDKVEGTFDPTNYNQGLILNLLDQ